MAKFFSQVCWPANNRAGYSLVSQTQELGVAHKNSFHWMQCIARNVQCGEEAAKKLESEGLQPTFLKLDVDSEESIEAAKDAVKEKYGRLDVLINNAAILLRVGPL